MQDGTKPLLKCACHAITVCPKLTKVPFWCNTVFYMHQLTYSQHDTCMVQTSLIKGFDQKRLLENAKLQKLDKDLY